MDDLFVVYRYLATNRHRTDEHNPYTIAFRTLDSYVNVERDIASYANKIRTTGGLQWSDATKLKESLLTGFETGLNTYYGDPLSAAIAFMRKYIDLAEIETFIAVCKGEQARMQREEDEESEALEEEERQSSLDSGSMIEDQ